MKTLYIFFILICTVGVIGSYADASKNLTVQTQVGSEKSVSVTTIRKILFHDGQLVIYFMDETSCSFALSSLNKLYFQVATNSKHTISTAVTVYPNPASDVLIIKNLPEGENRLHLYRLDGTLICHKRISSNETMLDVSALNDGLYLLCVNEEVYKITIQK